jgi:hypothetical protein
MCKVEITRNGDSDDHGDPGSIIQELSPTDVCTIIKQKMNDISPIHPDSGAGIGGGSL